MGVREPTAGMVGALEAHVDALPSAGLEFFIAHVERHCSSVISVTRRIGEGGGSEEHVHLDLDRLDLHSFLALEATVKQLGSKPLAQLL